MRSRGCSDVLEEVAGAVKGTFLGCKICGEYDGSMFEGNHRIVARV